MTGLIVAGLAVGQRSFAAAARDCGEEVNGVHNSIANNPDSGGGCGALTPSELVDEDIPNGDPDDQGAVFAHFGLSPGEYGRFKSAEMGVAKTNGDIVVGDETVMTNAWSIGRVKFSYSTEYPISGVGTFFKSMHTDVLKSDIPVMVMFDDNGEVEAAVLTACGNPVKGEKVRHNAVCKDLIKTPVSDKKDTFTFTTLFATSELVDVVKLDYFANGELFDTTSTPDEATKQMTFTEDTTVVVKVTISLPGDKTKTVESEACKAFIEVKKKEVPPPEKPKEKPKVEAAAVVKPPAQPAGKILPVTGPGDLAGLFLGASLAGAVGHRLYKVYRGRAR